MKKKQTLEKQRVWKKVKFLLVSSILDGKRNALKRNYLCIIQEMKENVCSRTEIN